MISPTTSLRWPKGYFPLRYGQIYPKPRGLFPPRRTLKTSAGPELFPGRLNHNGFQEPIFGAGIRGCIASLKRRRHQTCSSQPGKLLSKKGELEYGGQNTTRTAGTSAAG